MSRKTDTDKKYNKLKKENAKLFNENQFLKSANSVLMDRIQKLENITTTTTATTMPEEKYA